MDFRICPSLQEAHEHWSLWAQTNSQVRPMDHLGFFFKRLVQADFLVLKNHFKITRISLWNQSTAKIYCLLYEPKEKWPGPVCLGAFAISNDISESEAHFFWQRFLQAFPNLSPVAPMNGHAYLGLSLPDELARVDRIGFMTSGRSKALEKLLLAHPHTSIYRTLYSYETKVTPERIQKWQEVQDQRPASVTIRSFSLWQSQKDLNTLNQLVNQCFASHFDFCSLSDEENYDIMKLSPIFLRRGLGLFLEYDKKPIGFGFGFKDYHQVIKPNQDLLNLWRMFTTSKIDRGRLVHIGILPQYRGQKLIKYLRYPLLLNLHQQGCQSIENSYIDEGNINSQKNVQSTGAEPLNQFHLYQLKNS